MLLLSFFTTRNFAFLLDAAHCHPFSHYSATVGVVNIIRVAHPHGDHNRGLSTPKEIMLLDNNNNVDRVT
jgi:metal-dependent hydrolase (beta-lactamase superfamily II)